METPVILVYHKNASTIYPREWLDQFINSIRAQTHQDFKIMEMNYGGDKYRLFPDSTFYSETTSNFVHALMRLVNYSRDQGYQYIFNTNIDDWYSPNWISTELEFLKQGYDVVSSNFTFVDAAYELPRVFHHLDIKQELCCDHNIIAHPAVAYNISFFNDYNYNPEEIPREDLLLWQRAIETKKFVIVPENMLWHRIHNQSVCQSTNR